MLEIRTSRLLVLLVMLLSAGAVSCGGVAPEDQILGDGPGNSNTGAYGFTPDGSNPQGARTAAMSPSGSTGDLVTVGIDVSDTDDLFGASMDLVYDPGLVEFVDWAPGGLLETGGESVSYQLSTSQPGVAVIGVSRTGSAPGLQVSGTGTLIRVTLRVLGAPTDLAFQNATLFDSQSPPQPIAGIAWFGGTVASNP